MQATRVTGTIIKIEELATVRDNGTIMTIEGIDKIIHIVVNGDSGIAMTRITITETIGTEIRTVKVTLTGVEDGIIITMESPLAIS